MKTSRKTAIQAIAAAWALLFIPTMTHADDFLDADLWYGFQSGSNTRVSVGGLRNASATHITIPSTVVYEYTDGEDDDGDPIVKHRTCHVMSIGDYAFSGCNALTSVTIPDSVTNIGWNAFFKCSGLTSVTIPGSVKTIGIGAFEDCTGLGSVTIGNGVTHISADAFRECSRLTSVTIPDSVQHLSDWAFYNCSGLMSLKIGSGITRIESGTFYNCSGLTSVTIPENVTEICDGAFSSCRGLKSIAIPNSVTNLGGEAFSFCTGLTEAVIPGSIKSFDNMTEDWQSGSAFYECTALKNVTILDGIPSIPLDMFSRCRALTSVVLPESVANIGRSAFSDCSELTDVWFRGTPPSIEPLYYVGEDPFRGVAEGARGHYEPEYADAWKKVIDSATGMWEGLVFDDSVPYMVSFNANGGEGEMEPVTVEGEGTVVLPANAFWRTNYRFEGWATNQNGEVVYEDEAEIPVEQDMTLWAVWDYVEPPSIYGVKVGPYSDWDFSEIVSPQSAKTRATEPELYNSLENCLVLTDPIPTVKPLIKIRLQDRPNGTYRCLFKNKFYDVNEEPTKVIQEDGIQYGLYEVSLIPFEKIESANLTDPNSYGPKKDEITLTWTIKNSGKKESGSKSETFEYNVFFNPLKVVAGEQLWYTLWKEKDMLPQLNEFTYKPANQSTKSITYGKTISLQQLYLDFTPSLVNIGRITEGKYISSKFVYQLPTVELPRNVLINTSGEEVFSGTSGPYFIDKIFQTVRHENNHEEIMGQYTQFELISYDDTSKKAKWLQVGDPDNDGLNKQQEASNGTCPNNHNTKNIVYGDGDERYHHQDQELYVRKLTELGESETQRQCYYKRDWSTVGPQAPAAMRGAQKSALVKKGRVAEKSLLVSSSLMEFDSLPIPQKWYDIQTAETLVTYGEAPEVVIPGDAVNATTNAAEEGLVFTIPVTVGTAADLTFRAYLLDNDGNALAEAVSRGMFSSGTATAVVCFSANTMAEVAKKSTGPYILDRVGCRLSEYSHGESVWSESPLIAGISCDNVVWHSEESYVAGDGQCMKTSSGLAITLPVFLPAAGTYTFAARLVPDGGSQAISVAMEELQVSGLGIVNVTLNFPADDIAHSKHTGAFRLHSLSVTSDDADVGDWLVPNFKTPSYSYTEFQSSEQSVVIDAETLSDSILYDGDGMAVSLVVSFTARNSDTGQLGRGRFKAVLESEDGREVARFNEIFPMTNASDTYVLAFSGTDIRAAGVAGPYVLASLSIEDPDTGEILDAVTSASWKTAAYGTSTFATGLSADVATFVLGEVKDAGAEQSGIRLSGTVEIPTAGIVDFEANLVNAAGTQVCSGYSQTDCPAGVSTVSLVFPAPALFQSGLDGPYCVTSATATYSGRPEAPVVIPLALETQPYACGDFAKWSNYMVTLDRQNGSGGTANVTAMHGKTMPDIMIPTRNGYAFLGYYSEPNGKGIQYYTANGRSARNWDRVADTTLYAHWTERQTVTFEPNGGTCKTSSRTAVVGETYTKLASATREGYKFVGWYDAQEGGNRVKIGDPVPAQAERTLWARWEGLPQTVRFDANGGTCKTSSRTAVVGETYTKLASATREGYKFVGWYDALEGGNRVRVGDTVPPQTERTLWARWEGLPQTVRFDANGGICKTSSRTAVVGETYTKLASATREGYKFVGWYDAQEGGNRVRVGDTVPPQAERTLWARWEGLPQTVRFDANGGTCKTSSRTAVVGETYTKLASATREGYKFVGWYDAQEGGNRVKIGDTVTPQTERTLWARWEGLPQTVRFDANGGTCSKTSAKYYVGETYTGFKIPTRDGYKFLGWYDAQEGGTRVKNGMTVTVDSERTLYAHWHATAAALSITGFSRSSRPVPAVRDARALATECTLRVETIADAVYEVQWTPELGGAWTVLKRWTADADGETAVSVSVPAGEATGFFRVREVAD